MNMLARPVIKNKFYIVEQDGEKVATIQINPDSVVLVHNQQRERFASIKTLQDKHNIVFDKTARKKDKAKDTEGNEVYGYPCSNKPHNELYDVQKKLPLYSKNAKSKSKYCAGYYVIQFQNAWLKSYCPKFITLQRYPYHGPYKTKLEMQEQLKKLNND
jgi:hypothetical protein